MLYEVITNNVSIITSKDVNKEDLDIYEFNSLEEEVIFLATKISSLVKEGISLDKIKINTLDSVYKAPINRIFNFYNIPVNVITSYSIHYTKLYDTSLVWLLNPLTFLLLFGPYL